MYEGSTVSKDDGVLPENKNKRKDYCRNHQISAGSIERRSRPVLWAPLSPAAIVVLLVQGPPWIRLLKFILVPLAALILVTVLRHVFHAPRPYDQMNYYPLISHKPGNSFPSRHTASSVIIAMAFWYVCQPLGITAAALAVLVGISRVVAGLHYPRDVLAGAAVSLVVGGLGFWVV